MGLRRDLLLFPQGRKRALTFSYDDAVTQDVRLVRMLNQYGMKGTFNINTGLLGKESIHVQDGKTVTHNKLRPEEIADVYRGHELAVHGLTHQDLALAGAAAAAYETAADRKNIEDLVKAPVRGMAYPFGTYTEELADMLRLSGISYARTTKSTGGFDLPQDFLTWHPTCHHSEERLFELTEAFFAPERKYYGPRLFYVWGHSYEFDVREDWGRMEQFLDRMAGQEDVWYAANIEICDYVNDAKRLRYSSSGEYISNPAAQDIWLSVGGKTVCIRSGATVCV
ncbi:MAG TPA: polysaccharide deacetylase family protein [Candidatus Choladousia intestinipullorum]|nr:polysaccharide deacetylase family protein [Candidatus Choladousia intestinipullorum]